MSKTKGILLNLTEDQFNFREHVRGIENPKEKYFRDTKILQIYKGTRKIQKNEIAAGQIKENATRK